MKKILISAIGICLFFASCESTFLCECDVYDARTGTSSTVSREIDGTRASATSECANSTSGDPDLIISGCHLDSDGMEYYDSY